MTDPMCDPCIQIFAIAMIDQSYVGHSASDTHSVCVTHEYGPSVRHIIIIIMYCLFVQNVRLHLATFKFICHVWHAPNHVRFLYYFKNFDVSTRRYLRCKSSLHKFADTTDIPKI